MVNIFDQNNFNNMYGISPLVPILICSTQLGANYDLWCNDEKIQEIVDLDKNFFCKFLKNNHPYLDEKSIKCIALAAMLHMYKETMNIISPELIAENKE
jgi:hypothetical protein